MIFLVLLPFLLISPSRFRMRHGYLMLAGAALLLLLVEVGGWNVVAYSKFTRALAGADPREQLSFIASNPLRFVGIIARDVWMHTPSYMQGWIGVYGYDYWPVPALTYFIYPLALVVALWQPLDGPRPDGRTRLVLIGLFVLGYLLTIVSLYVAFTPARSLFVAGVQGRYFTVVMPLLFLASYPRAGICHPPGPAGSGCRIDRGLGPRERGRFCRCRSDKASAATASFRLEWASMVAITPFPVDPGWRRPAALHIRLAVVLPYSVRLAVLPP